MAEIETKNIINTIPIKNLMQTSSVNDSDIMIIEDETTTYKIKAEDLMNYIREVVKDTFVQLTQVGASNGVVPLDSSQKIDSVYLNFGEVTGTAYEGNAGKTLENDLTAHKDSTGNVHGMKPSDIGLGNVENKNSETIRGEITKKNITDGLGFVPEIEGAYSNSVAYTNTKIEPIEQSITTINTQLKNVATQDYVTTKFNDLVNGAESGYDTFKEIQDQMKEDDTALDSLIKTVGNKIDTKDVVFATNADIDAMFA